MDWLALYLEEDLGPGGLSGDLTSDALLAGQDGRAHMVLRESGTVAGLAVACELFRRLGAEARPRVEDGADAGAGEVLVELRGPSVALLAGERTALNIVGRMSGIATKTRQLARRLEGTRCKVAGTRKTTPGFRAYEKEAIRIGGGDPHRMGLYDVLMVKDNHRAAAGDLATAIRRLQAAHPDLELEVEVESRADAVVAAQEGVDWVLVDNQAPDVGAAWAAEVRRVSPGTRVEASGGIREEDVAAYSWADRVSLGALTHQAVSLDVGLDWV